MTLKRRASVRLFCLHQAVAGFRVESVEGLVTDAIPPNEVYDEKHEQRPTDHDRDGQFQPHLQVAEIRDLADDVRSKPANQLCCEHVDADGSGMCAAGHHVVKYGSDGAMVPGHEKEGDGKTNKHG